MHALVSLLPPPAVRVALLDALALPSPAPVPPEPEPSRGLFRRARRRAAPSPPHRAPTWCWEPVDETQLHLPVTHFGKVTPPDLRRLETTLGSSCAAVEPFRLSFSDPLLVDDEIRVEIDAGDRRDELRDLARALVRAAERVGFYCDRRVFHTSLLVARTHGHDEDGRQARDGLDHLAQRLREVGAAGEPAWLLDEATLMRRLVTGPPGSSTAVRHLPFVGGGQPPTTDEAH